MLLYSRVATFKVSDRTSDNVRARDGAAVHANVLFRLLCFWIIRSLNVRPCPCPYFTCVEAEQALQSSDFLLSSILMNEF